MRPRKKKQGLNFVFGFLTSLIGHLVISVVVIVVLETRAAQAVRAPEIFTVTLEGGEVLGGVANLPEKMPDKPSTETQIPDAGPEPEAEPEPIAEPKQIEEPTVVEQPSEEELKKKAEAEKKRKAKEAKKKKEAEKKKKEDAKKKKEKAAKKKAEDEKKAKAARKRQFEKRMAERRQGAKKRIDSESYDAGGVGMGAARYQKGGKGRGGGTLTSLEKLSYMNALENHIKSGWRWISSNEKLTAIVRFRILANGAVQNVRLERTSGSVNFDDSVIRAVRKAAPVPAPPAKFAAEFSDIRITFDSKE